MVLELIRQPIDWRRLLEAATYHGLQPLVWRHLSRLGGGSCPAPVLNALETESRRISLRNLGLAAELAELVSFFRSKGVHVVSLKGPIAAVAYYGDPGLRSFVDIDLLVPRGEALTAWRLLESRRYTARFPLKSDWQELFVRRGSEELFHRGELGPLVDLHWDIWAPGYTFTPESDEPWAAREVVKLGSIEVETLAPEAMALFFCLHGAKHSWVGLKWVCDLAELLRSRPALEWGPMLEWSAPRGRRRLVDWGLRLAHELLGAPVPPDVLARGSADPEVGTLAARAILGILRFDDPPPSLWSAIVHPPYAQAMEQTRDRLRYLHDALLAPTPIDWNLVPLPPAFAPLYYGVRPLRLVWKHAPWHGARG